VTSRRRGVHGARYVALDKGAGRVDVIVTSSGSVYESTLIVHDVRAADAGLYVCSLSSSAGHISSTHAYLTVLTGTVFCCLLLFDGMLNDWVNERENEMNK